MTEQNRFDRLLVSALDELSPPPHLPERIASRVDRAEARRRAMRAGAAVAAVVVVMAAAIVAVDRREERPVVADASGRPFRWERLPDAPVPPRARATAVWTGEEVLLWGGGSPGSSHAGLRADGAAYNPSAKKWRKLPSAPIGPRSNHIAAWTGREMIVWGGTRAGDGPAGWADGAAYDPVTDTWRRIPEAPIGGRINVDAAWTGAELVVVGGMGIHGVAQPGTGAAYDPARNSWRLLPDLGFTSQTGAWVAWTGEVVLYWRGAGPALFAYDPESNAWTERARPGDRFRLSSGPVVVWADHRLVVTWETSTDDEWAEVEAISYDPVLDRWDRLARTENTDNQFASPMLYTAWTGHEVVALGTTGYAASAFEPRTGRWYVLPRPPSVGVSATTTTTDHGDVYVLGDEAAARLTRDP